MTAVVADFDAGDAEAAFAERPWLAAEHLDQHRGLAAHLHIGQQADRPVPMAVREAQQEVAHGGDSRFGCRLRQLRSDSLRALQARRRERSGAASGPGRRGVRRDPARARPRSERTTGPRAATTSSAGRPRGSRSRPRPGRGCRSPSSGIGASSPAITVTISAPSARCWIVVVRVEPVPPQATISPSAKPTASPFLKRPWASSRAAGAMPPLATPASAPSSRRRSPRQRRSGRARPGPAGSPAAMSPRTTRAGFSESSQARSAAMITLEELGRTSTSSEGTLVDPGQQLVGRGVERLAAGHDVGAELGEEPLQAVAGGDRDDAGPARFQPRRRARPSARACRRRRGWSPRRRPRTAPPPPPDSSVWTWTLSVASSPTTSTESPSPSSRGRNPREERPLPETMKLVQ